MSNDKTLGMAAKALVEGLEGEFPPKNVLRSMCIFVNGQPMSFGLTDVDSSIIGFSLATGLMRRGANWSGYALNVEVTPEGAVSWAGESGGDYKS